MKTTSPFGDKRTALAFFLSLIVIISYTELVLKPTEMERAAQKAAIEANSSENAQEESTSPKVVSTAGPKAAEGASSQILPNESSEVQKIATAPTHQEIEQAPKTVIETPTYRAVLTHLGGRLQHFELKNHTKELHGEELYDLVSVAEDAEFPFGVSLLGGTDAALQFGAPEISTSGEQSGGVVHLKKGQEAKVIFQIPLSTGGVFSKSFRFVGGSFFVDLAAKMSEPDVPEATPLAIRWSGYVPEEVASSKYDPVSFSFLFPNNKVEHLGLVQVDNNSKVDKITQWTSLGDKYFMTSLISPSGSQTTWISRKNDNYAIDAIGSKEQVAVKAYLGPKNYSDLKKLDFELHRNVNLGIFSFLAIPLLTVINVCYGFLGNYGLAIILMTLLIKFLFLPLTQVSFRSMKAMQDLQPEIKALRERIKDPNQLNQEMFALYKRKGVNPMGGCFPMFIQIPVFLGLYNALLNATELRHSPFALWITDLSAPEALNVGGIPIPVMIIMMGISMFLQQWLTPSNMDEQQKKIMMIMPVMFTVMFIIFPFPSGLVLYWLVNNLISIVQQVYLRTDRNVGPVQATALASVGIFLIGFTLTLI